MQNGDAMQRTMELIRVAVAAEGFEELSNDVLPRLAGLTAARSAFLYVSDLRLHAPHFGNYDLPSSEASVLEQRCSTWLENAQDAETSAGSMRIPIEDGTAYAVHPMQADGRVIGVVGVSEDGMAHPSSGGGVWPGLLATLGRVADHLAAHVSAERKLHHLNTYLTVSSMLAKSVDLAELLEIALYCCMETSSADAASILLLDETKENFQFYRVEGAAKPLLGGSTFPATEGVAGRVLESREAEIVNDVESDPRFYEQIDLKTGFRTHNLIAVPLIAGDESVGVLEVLNRADGGLFTADERLILVSVADEIAFAIRNATIFDYVVNTYCKRRQGQNSCKGCERPLGSWTPCMRYREYLP